MLTAKHHEREAAIVAEAGRLGMVTIATNMAGRGTDIILGETRNSKQKKRCASLGTMKYDSYASSRIPLEDEELIAAREEYDKLYEKYARGLKGKREHDKVIELGGLTVSVRRTP